jgi:hypothetical protein
MRFHVLCQFFEPFQIPGPLVTLQKFRGPPRNCISGSVSTESTYKRKAAVISERLEIDSQFVGDGADDNTEAVVIVT